MAGNNYQPYTRRQTMIRKDFEIYRYRSSYLNEVELHHHDFYEVYLLLRGEVAYTVENHIYNMRPGDLMLVSRWNCTRRGSSRTATPTSGLCSGLTGGTWKIFPARAPA